MKKDILITTPCQITTFYLRTIGRHEYKFDIRRELAFWALTPSAKRRNVPMEISLFVMTSCTCLKFSRLRAADVTSGRRVDYRYLDSIVSMWIGSCRPVRLFFDL